MDAVVGRNMTFWLSSFQLFSIEIHCKYIKDIKQISSMHLYSMKPSLSCCLNLKSFLNKQVETNNRSESKKTQEEPNKQLKRLLSSHKFLYVSSTPTTQNG